MSVLSVVPTTAIRVDVVSPHAVVVAGIRSLVEGDRHGLHISARRREIGVPDVVFYDVIGLHESSGADLDHWVRKTGSVVIALTQELRPDLGAAALERGVDGAVSIGASADDLLDVIVAALDGRLGEMPVVRDAVHATRLGSGARLTLREAETVALIVQGMSNHQIADMCGLSINSVKSYIRNAYRKMCVESRSQAVAWGIQHGFPAVAEKVSEVD